MAVQVDRSEEGQRKFDERAARFKEILVKLGIAEHGAQTHIAKEVGCTDSRVAAWMRGSLPRDPEVLFRFCDIYGVDPYWWVSGKARPRHEIDEDLIVQCMEYVTERAQKKEAKPNPKQLTRIAALVYKDWNHRQEIADRILEFFRSYD